MMIGILLMAQISWAQNAKNEIRIAHIYEKTGPLEAYAKDLNIGVMLGLEYATGGTMMLNGKKIILIERDSQGKADIARTQLAAAFADDKADIAISGNGSGVTLAMLPIAEEYQKILVVDLAVADSITGDKWNKYIFHTARNSSQDALTNAYAINKDNTTIAVLAQDYAYGRDGVKAFKEAMTHAKIVHEEYLPVNTTDFTAGASRLIEALRHEKGRKIIFILWAGAANPFKIAELDLKRYGIEIATSGNTLPAMKAYKAFEGMEGAIYYYYGIPKNPINDWLINRVQKDGRLPPDYFEVGGFSAAMSIITALKQTGGNTDSQKLIATMEGMSFDTPKGKMTFRAEDHQALQSMYHFKIRVDPKIDWAVPELVQEITPDKIKLPIRNK